VPETVAVVGAGIAGLAAAWELTGGAAGPGPGSPAVVVLEASGRVGGKLRTVEVGGLAVDAGADGFLGRRPEAAALCRELGLAGELVPIARSGAAVWVRGRRRDLPGALALGVPTRFLPAARSGILGARGSLRLLVDVVSPRRDLRGPLGDRAIGPLVGRKLGRRVVDRLVDPLVGGIHAGGVADMSAAAVFPLLLVAAEQRGSLMRRLRRATAGSGGGGDERGGGSAAGGGPGNGGGTGRGTATGGDQPLFWTLRDGVASLPVRLAAALAGRGVAVHCHRPVDGLERGGPGRPAWILRTPAGPVAADGLVLAVPPAAAAALLAPYETEAAGLLRGIDHAAVAVVTLLYPEDAVPGDLAGTGLLVPRGSPAPDPLDGDLLVTACTYLDAKWPNLGRPGGRLLRASVGRFGDHRPAALDDGALVARVVAELEVLLGTGGPPVASAVARWPDALPQYRVHHLLRVAGIEAAVRRLPAAALAGAAYHGVGIPACVASGRGAARAVLEALGRPPGGGTPGT
jgi:oxygen-dependent protoporphyrinogen oxidase